MAAPRVSLSGAGASRLLCAAAVVLGQAVSIAILMATVLYAGYCAIFGLYPLSAKSAFALLPFAGTIVAGRNLRRKLQGRPHWRMAHAWFLGFTLASMLASLEWFKGPMHDIALAFGSHGRWGCSVYDEDGSPVYLLRDSTVPFILFVPILSVAAAHWFATRRARVPAAPS
jgi:hypothetical protein